MFWSRRVEEARHLTEFGYKQPQAAVTVAAEIKTPLQVGLTKQITSKGGSGIGKFVYKSQTPTLSLSSQLGAVKALKVGSCSTSPSPLGVVVLAVQKAVIGTKTGSATFVRKIVVETTIRVRISGKTLTTYKFLGN